MKKMNLLSKAEMKKVTGGLEAAAGQCVHLQTNSGMQSCWYTTGSPIDLFHRVYPGQGGVATYGYPCDGCVMN